MIAHPRTTTSPPISVRAEDMDAWQRALDRGRRNELPVTFLNLHGVEPPTVTHYLVGSASEPWREYTVALWRDEHGVTTGHCECTAGAFGRICQHVALALSAAGWLPVAEPVETIAPSMPCCPSCGALDTVISIMRETNPRGWQPWYRCAACRAVIGYGYELDAATRRLIGVPAWV